MRYGKLFMVVGWDYSFIKIGLEEIVQRDMESLEGGEVGGCEVKRLDGWLGYSQGVR